MAADPNRNAGFPVALMLAWALEITPEGIKRAEDVLPNALRGDGHRAYTTSKDQPIVAFALNGHELCHGPQVAL